MKKKPVTNTVFVQVIERPERKLILKRAKKAEDYFSYCEEVDCEIWGLLCSIKEALYEPIGMWLPDAFRAPGTSYYAQGVEVPIDYNGKVPEGLDIITLPPCKMMVFQGQPYNDEDFKEAITQLWDVMKTTNRSLHLSGQMMMLQIQMNLRVTADISRTPCPSINKQYKLFIQEKRRFRSPFLIHINQLY